TVNTEVRMGISVKVDVSGHERKARDAARRCRVAIPSRDPEKVGRPYGEFLMELMGISAMAKMASGFSGGSGVQGTVSSLETLRRSLESDIRRGGGTITTRGSTVTIEFAKGATIAHSANIAPRRPTLEEAALASEKCRDAQMAAITLSWKLGPASRHAAGEEIATVTCDFCGGSDSIAISDEDAEELRARGDEPGQLAVSNCAACNPERWEDHPPRWHP
ncbi:MAG TPA: hypothetical protein VGD87_01290, partial [Archangium sp.]